MFSVLIPVYNHERYLAEAVTSALRSIFVTEVLLVDDGSQDRSREVISSLSRSRLGIIRDLTVPTEGNLGAHARLNQLVGAAKNEWVAILNSDDAFVPGRFETAVAHLKKGAQTDFIFGHLLIMNSDGVVIGTKRGLLQPEYAHPFSKLSHTALASQPVTDLLANQNFIGTTSNMIFKRSLHQRLGGFAPLRYAHDWAFALTASVKGNPYYLPHFLTKYRVHDGNTIRENKDAITSEVRTLFGNFLKEYPDYIHRPTFHQSIRANNYLSQSGPLI